MLAVARALLSARSVFRGWIAHECFCPPGVFRPCDRIGDRRSRVPPGIPGRVQCHAGDHAGSAGAKTIAFASRRLNAALYIRGLRVRRGEPAFAHGASVRRPAESRPASRHRGLRGRPTGSAWLQHSWSTPRGRSGHRCFGSLFEPGGSRELDRVGTAAVAVPASGVGMGTGVRAAICPLIARESPAPSGPSPARNLSQVAIESRGRNSDSGLWYASDATRLLCGNLRLDGAASLGGVVYAPLPRARCGR